MLLGFWRILWNAILCSIDQLDVNSIRLNRSTLRFSFLKKTTLPVSAYLSAKTSQRFSKPCQHWVSAIACLKSPDFLPPVCGIHWFLFREQKFTLHYEKSHWLQKSVAFNLVGPPGLEPGTKGLLAASVKNNLYKSIGYKQSTVVWKQMWKQR